MFFLLTIFLIFRIFYFILNTFFIYYLFVMTCFSTILRTLDYILIIIWFLLLLNTVETIGRPHGIVIIETGLICIDFTFYRSIWTILVKRRLFHRYCGWMIITLIAVIIWRGKVHRKLKLGSCHGCTLSCFGNIYSVAYSTSTGTTLTSYFRRRYQWFYIIFWGTISNYW